MNRIVIFANGLLPDPVHARRLLRADDTIVCADGGSRHAFALGLTPQALIGDLDSVSDAERQRIEAAGIEVLRYPHDKDQTDLELSLQYALKQKPSSILIVAALGNRLDHTLGNLAILTCPRLAALDCRLDDGLEEAFFCRSRSDVHGAPGDIVSLIPWGGAVAGVRTEGLRWPLLGETLYTETSRGISNEMLSEAAKIQLDSGLLLVVHRRQP
jgi:thiamine pyrophosphokinase